MELILKELVEVIDNFQKCIGQIESLLLEGQGEIRDVTLCENGDFKLAISMSRPFDCDRIVLIREMFGSNFKICSEKTGSVMYLTVETAMIGGNDGKFYELWKKYEQNKKL